ncbi:hypothetical protein MBLNU459_g4514t1 [Dothideomycetes sp. NU459]
MAGLLQYAPWTSDIEIGFYTALASLKINHDKLDSSARKVLGLYEIQHRDQPERSVRMQIHGNALTTGDVPSSFYRAEGIIRNFNTIEEYKQVDKAAHIERAGRTIWDAINDGTIYSCPSLLSSFSAICFADLKKYKFGYHFAYPALHSDPQWRHANPQAPEVTRLSSRETTNLVDRVQTWKYSVDTRQHGFFLAKRVRGGMLEPDDEPHTPSEEVEAQGPRTEQFHDVPTTPGEELDYTWGVGALASYENGFFNNVEPEDRFVCFVDPSTYPTNPGWMLRNLLVLARQRWNLDDLQVLCYRDTHVRREHPSSIIFHLQCSRSSAAPETAQDQVTSTLLMPSAVRLTEQSKEQRPTTPSPRSISVTERGPVPKITGWERNDQGKVLSRLVDLAAYMDPQRLADQAVDLNLKLIKWRIAPSIDLDVIKNTSYLLLGAGTLGSYVARNLMGWGARKITFVDNAKVSYSNPVRQPLYDFKDCLNGGAVKATRAAEALQEIYPGVESKGYVMSVPMAGHPIIDEDKVKREYDKLHELIESHDAIFLLMDTRESRWLPTVMAKSAGKIVINAALGFDTYMVMRHGAGALSSSQEEGELGCYFCNDVVAPADSLKAATLDQQCTVTRPGVAPLASALAVELLVSVLQHPRRAHAPAPAPNTSSSSSTPDPHPLGTVPHQLRGFLANWQTMIIKGRSYDCCSACSPPILAAYERDGWQFVKRAINEKGFVEDVSGLAEVQKRAEEMDNEVEWDSGEDEDGDGEIV